MPGKGLLDDRASLEVQPVAGAVVSQDDFSGHFSALRHRNFRLFYAGHVLSMSGTWLQITAIGWLVLELTNSEFWLGVVNAATSVPILFFSLYAGYIADRSDKRRILIVAQGVAFAQALTLALLSHFELINVGWIVFLALILGISNAFEIPTRQSFFVELVGERDLTNAIALNSAAFNATRMVGPAIAGSMIAAVGIAACFYLNAVSYLAVIAGLLAIRRPRPELSRERVSAVAHIREGFDWMSSHPTARAVVMHMSMASIFVFPYTMLLPVFARDVLQVGAPGLGWLYSATGLGALIGGLSITSLAYRLPRGALLVGSGIGMSVLVAGFALSDSFPLSLLLLAGAGFCMILTTATANSLIQMLVPNDMRGRVMAVYVVLFLGVTPLGYLLAGSFGRLVGVRATLVGGTAIFLSLLLWSARRSPVLRRIE